MVCRGVKWRLVEAVASGLLARSRLSYSEARRIIQESIASATAGARRSRPPGQA
jgi:hypothetical protein